MLFRVWTDGSGRLARATGLAAIVAGATGCLDSSVTFPVTRELSVSSSDLPVVAGLSETNSDGMLVVPHTSCTDVGQCPSDPVVNVECNASNECDPLPTTATVAMQEIDLTEVRERFSVVDSVGLRGVEYVVVTNTLNTDMPAVNVYWGPVGLTDISGAMRLGTFPATRAGETPMGEVALDSVGTNALNDHLGNVSFRFVIFLETTLDIDPGDLVPQGDVAANIQFEIRASGRVI